MNVDLDLTLNSDALELIEVASHQAMNAILSGLLDKGVFHIALTGGTLGGDFARALTLKINKAGNLSGLHIWFSDERFDISSSSSRNSRSVHDELSNTSVTLHEVLSPDAGVTVIDAAQSYEVELREIVMDICILGLGPDGHIASLFPNNWTHIQENNKKTFAIVDSPKPPAERVSFSMNFINASQEVWLIAAGESKVKAVRQILEADRSVPAGHVKAASLTRLIVDTEAFISSKN